MGAYLNYDRLQKYLGPELYCREERQYAVFLYNIFLKKKMNMVLEPDETEIIRDCLDLEDVEETDIDDVYFEATIMRDYFKKDRIGFNRELLTFCLGWLSGDSILIGDSLKKDGINSNLGQKKIKDYVDEAYKGLNLFDKNLSAEDRERARQKVCLDIARMMMNATLDLLVVYTRNGTKYAKALECKYESNEGTYKDIVGVNCKMQLFIQECIMHFCFGESKNEKGKFVPPFPGGSSKWKNEKDLWEDICLNVYEGILKQTRDNMEMPEVRNAGIEMVRFCRPTEGTESRNIIQINKDVYIQVSIEPGKPHPLANDHNNWRIA